MEKAGEGMNREVPYVVYLQSKVDDRPSHLVTSQLQRAYLIAGVPKPPGAGHVLCCSPPPPRTGTNTGTRQSGKAPHPHVRCECECECESKRA